MRWILAIISVPLLAQTEIAGPAKIAGPTISTFSASGAITWTLVQEHDNLTTSCPSTSQTTTCTLSGISAIGANHLLFLVISYFSNTDTPAFSSCSISGETTVHPTPSSGALPSKENYSSTNWEVADVCYVANSAGGGTTASYVWTTLGTPSSNTDITFLEFARSSGAATLDGSVANTQGACTTCAGPTPTVTGTDLVVAWNANENGCASVASPFNVSPSPVFENPNVAGFFSWSLSQASANAASYTCTSGAMAAGTISFK